jgi:hypothetical protein
MDGKTIEKESLSAMQELKNDTDNQKVEKYVCNEMTHKSDCFVHHLILIWNLILLLNYQ